MSDLNSSTIPPAEIIAATKRGWKLFPLCAHDDESFAPRDRGKVPPHGFVKWQHRATSDTEQLKAWAEMFPGCNWAVATGAGSSIVVVDIDGQIGRDARAALEKEGLILPPTLTVTTGREDGGEHLYYQIPTDSEVPNNNTGKIGDHIDIKSTGGYCVCASSTHFTRRVYNFIDPDVAIAPLPDWVVERLRRPTQLPAVAPDAATNKVGKGKRHNLLVSLFGTLRKRDVSPEAITAALLAENTARCDPALSEQDVRKLAQDLLDRYSPGAPIKQYTVLSPSKIGPDLVCLANVKALPVPWLWRGYLALGMLAMLSGDPDAGKTFIALAIAAELSQGRVPVSGEVCEPISTLYLSHENSPEYVTRPRFDAQGGNPDRFILLRGSTTGEDEDAIKGDITLKDIPILDAALARTGARLVIIDPVQSFLGAEVDAHRSNETRPVMDGLIALAEKYHACILILRHLTKAPGGRAIHRGLGSIDLTGAVRTEMLAGTAPGEPDNRAFIQIKNNLGQRMDAIAYEIVGDEMKAKLEWCGNSTLTSADLLAPDPASVDTTSEEEKAERIVKGVALLRAEIARRASVGKARILKTEAETFLMAARHRQKEARTIIASDCFEAIPCKGKGAPLELRCRVHRSDDRNGDSANQSTNPNKDKGFKEADFCRPLDKHMTEIDFSGTNMDKGDSEPPISVVTETSFRTPSVETGTPPGANGTPKSAPDEQSASSNPTDRGAEEQPAQASSGTGNGTLSWVNGNAKETIGYAHSADRADASADEPFFDVEV